MRLSTRTITPAAVVAACLCCFSIANAGKPAKPPGGDGSDPAPRFTVLELPISGEPKAVSEVSPSGTVTVAIRGSEAGYSSAAFARLNAVNGSVVASGFLPEPIFVDPNDGQVKNGASRPVDVNSGGLIVGAAATYDPGATGYPSPSQAVVWYDHGSGYEFEHLPRLPNTTDSGAYGVNEAGDIVGMNFDAATQTYTAVMWEAGAIAIADLNTPLTAEAGWDLRWASGINDAGLIVGSGWYEDALRGFLLDYQTGAIQALPLAGPATMSFADRINQFGRVIGNMSDGEGNPWGFTPDFHVGFAWNIGEPDPQVLVPSNLNTSDAFGQNDLGATVGVSFVPSDELLGIHTIPTLWESDAQGNQVVTELATLIPSKPDYTLAYAWDINNLGWIGVNARKFSKGRYAYHAALLIPNN